MNARKIAHVDLHPGMQFKTEGVWWQVVRILDAGHTTGTMTIQACRADSAGYLTSGAARLVWVTIVQSGLTVRAGTPKNSTVHVGRSTNRVTYSPRHLRDPHPYVDGTGGRWSRDDTAQSRLIAGLADAFETGLMA